MAKKQAVAVTRIKHNGEVAEQGEPLPRGFANKETLDHWIKTGSVRVVGGDDELPQRGATPPENGEDETTEQQIARLGADRVNTHGQTSPDDVDEEEQDDSEGSGDSE